MYTINTTTIRETEHLLFSSYKRKTATGALAHAHLQVPWDLIPAAISPTMPYVSGRNQNLGTRNLILITYFLLASAELAGGRAGKAQAHYPDSWKAEYPQVQGWGWG